MGGGRVAPHSIPPITVKSWGGVRPYEAEHVASRRKSVEGLTVAKGQLDG